MASFKEGYCPKREDETHCECWWDENTCCACGFDDQAVVAVIQYIAASDNHQGNFYYEKVEDAYARAALIAMKTAKKWDMSSTWTAYMDTLHLRLMRWMQWKDSVITTRQHVV